MLLRRTAGRPKFCPIKIMNKYLFDIEDLEPFFKDKFKINMPSNLRPIMLSMNDINLSKEELKEYHDYKKYFFQKGSPPSFPFRMVWVLKTSGPINLSAEEQLKVDTYEKMYLEVAERNWKVNNLFLKYDLTQQQAVNRIRMQNRNISPIIFWLANEVGKANQYRGLTIEGLKRLPEGLIQIGQEDSNTKGYFIYTSTSDKRRVRIRFTLWNQYNMELNRSKERLHCLQRFFQNFEYFENEAKERIESLFFFFDEYVGTEINIQLKNGKKIFKDKGFGRNHINYDFFIELLNEIEMKTGQNKS
jgi:hypothetical protein